MQLLSPSLLTDKRPRQTADCSMIRTKCLVISSRKNSLYNLQMDQRGLIRWIFLHVDFICTEILLTGLLELCSYSGLLTLRFLDSCWHNGDSLDGGALRAVKFRLLVRSSGYFNPSVCCFQTTTCSEFSFVLPDTRRLSPQLFRGTYCLSFQSFKRKLYHVSQRLYVDSIVSRVYLLVSPLVSGHILHLLDRKTTHKLQRWRQTQGQYSA